MQKNKLRKCATFIVERVPPGSIATFPQAWLLQGEEGKQGQGKSTTVLFFFTLALHPTSPETQYE